MPKAKFKRKGAPADVLAVLDSRQVKLKKLNICEVVNNQSEDASTGHKSDGSILNLPEEMICMILEHLPVVSISRVEQTCKHLQTVIKHARIWRKLLLNIIENEPRLVDFIPHLPGIIKSKQDQENNDIYFKTLFAELKIKLDKAWTTSDVGPSISRTNRAFGQFEEEHFLYHVITTGRHFLSFWGPISSESRAQKEQRSGGKLDQRPHKDYLVDVYDRATNTKVKRIHAHHGKPDIIRVVSDLNLVMMSYPGLLMVEMISLDKDQGQDKDYLDLNRSEGQVEHETGSVCDIVIRENISLRGVVFTRVVMVAINTEPLDNRHFHIGLVILFGLSNDRSVTLPLWSIEFGPVPIGPDGGVGQARFYNQCIQKKGLSDFTSDHVVVVVGGCEGSAVLAVVNTPSRSVNHKLQLRGEMGGAGGVAQDMEGGCEGGACQFSVVSLMIDKLHTHLCAILLSTGQIKVIDLYTGHTLFQRHLQFDGQLKLALHQPCLLGTQRIAIKFRNFVSFYDLYLSRVRSDICLEHVRTLRITNVDGRETRLDDNPSQELRRQFGELQKRVRALNHYTSGIQKKLDKGLRPGTVTQGVLSMTRKVQSVTSKLDQAHGKAREIEAIVIASMAFDNRYCHALTLNRDLVIFDMLGVLNNIDNGAGGSSRGRLTRAKSTSKASKVNRDI